MSHRHYCPDEATCRDRDPCCLWAEGDCGCAFANQCRTSHAPAPAPSPGVQPRVQPRRKKPRAQRRR